jgi:hypothetical protein
VITLQKLSNDASSDILPSLRQLNGDHHTGLQADDTSASPIPSRNWGTTYWTPTQISAQLNSVSGIKTLGDLFTYLAARVAIQLRAAAAPTAVNKHSPHIM